MSQTQGTATDERTDDEVVWAIRLQALAELTALVHEPPDRGRRVIQVP